MFIYSKFRGAAAACALAVSLVIGTANAGNFQDSVVDIFWERLSDLAQWADIEWQNTSWTITRPDATSTYRVVAYGDSIFAGFVDKAKLNHVALRASPHVSGEYLSHKWGANINVVRRAQPGATAEEVYKDKILSERSYMESENTRVVMFEMCGTDYLLARMAFQDQAGTCNYEDLYQALAKCTYYMERAMQTINKAAPQAKSKIIMNLYYPGFSADNTLTACTDARMGTKVNRRDKFLPILLKSNWRACNLAAQYGFKCADAFAEMMASDYDSNGDGLVDVDAVRYRAGEGESAYVNRILSLQSTLRSANTHYENSTTYYDYLLSDGVHQTYFGRTIDLSSEGNSGSGPSFIPDSEIVNGKYDDKWNQKGHERIGWLLSLYNPATP